MILGFLGKGGSGKSSLATQVVLYLLAQQGNILAIDADHNMDLAYNLFQGDIPEGFPYFGSQLHTFLQYVGLEDGKEYSKVFLDLVKKRFSIAPLDTVTESFSLLKKDNLRIMAAGPQTENVLYGKSCSHSLTTPLKVYLPLLDLPENDYVIVDEKAGADGVSTGIVTGIDVGIIVCEPALHSIKTALQIAELMDFYETPYLFVGNKIQSAEDKIFLERELGQQAIIYLPEKQSVKRNPGVAISSWGNDIQSLCIEATMQVKNDRLTRTQKKFQRNHHFKNI